MYVYVCGKKKICIIMKVWIFFFLFPRDDTELIYNWVNEKRVFSSYDFECSSMRNLVFFLLTHFLAKKDVT